MQVKSIGTRSFPSSIGALRSLANSFSLKGNITRSYRMPENDKDAIASHWNYVGKDLQIALDKYGKEHEEKYSRSISTK